MRKILIYFVVLFFCFQISAGELAEFYKQATYPKLKKITLKTKSLKIADLKLTLKEETSVYLMIAGDYPVGVALKNASFSYCFSDPYFLPVAKRNFKHCFKRDIKEEDGKIVVNGNADYVFIWNNSLGQKLSSLNIEGQSEFPEEVKKVFDGFFFPAPSIASVFQKFFKSSAITSVYLQSGKDKFVYEIDPVQYAEEILYAVMPYPFVYKDYRGKYYQAVLTVKTLKKNWFEKDVPLFSVVKTSLDVFNDKDEHVIVRSNQRVRVNVNNLGCFFASLLSRKYKDVFRDYKVNFVKINGEPADFIHTNGLLVVKFNKKHGMGDFVNVEVECQGDIAIHPGGDNFFSLGVEPWYPQPSLFMEKSEFTINFKAPSDYSLFASGETVESGEKDGYSFLKTRLEEGMQFPVVVAGKYHVYQKDYQGYKCTVASYALAKKKHALRLANNFFVAEDYYSNVFGFKYPFKEQKIVEVNSWGFGQAPPGLIFITKEAFSPLKDYFSKFFSQGVNQRFVHEVSHAYWGHVAKIPNYREMWISEALAQYSSALCIKVVQKSKKKGERVFKKIVKDWYSQTKMLNKGSVLFFAHYLSNESDRDYLDTWKLIYNKGPLVIHGIRMRLKKEFGNEKGDRMFVVFLRALARNGDFDYIYTQDMIGILNQLTGSDWTPYFQKYVLGTAVPEI